MKRFTRSVLCVFAASLLTAASSYQINYGANQDITEWSTCKNVSNSSPTGKALFVPTNTSTEWAAFYNASIPGVTIQACIVTNDIYCWGVNESGQRGDNTTTTIQIPTLAIKPAGVTAFGEIAVGNFHSCAIASEGSNAGKIYCWGANSSSQLGDNTTTNRLIPSLVTMPSGVTSFGAISSGNAHTCGIASAGANAGNVYCWGANNVSQLGDNTTTTRKIPTLATMPSGVTSFGEIGAGTSHTCAIATAGSNAGKIYCWGTNASGQLGDNTTTARKVPTLATMPAGVTAFASISVGTNHSCAIASAGSNAGKLYCWGSNSSGILGDNTTTNRLVPTLVTMPASVTAFGSVGLGAGHSCAIASAGTDAGNAFCWGGNSSGQLGNNTTTNSLIPTIVTMPPGVTAFGSIDGGSSHSCATASAGTDAGKIFCWGFNNFGQVGDNSTTKRLVPTLATMPAGVTAFGSIGGGTNYSCAF